MRRELRELLGDLAKGQPDALCEDDERNSSQNLSGESPLRVSFALGADEAALLIKAER